MMKRTAERLRSDAVAIWQAGVDAVRGDRLVQAAVHVEAGTLHVQDEMIPLADIRRIVVVGAGKAGAGMAAGLESALPPELMSQKQMTGWVNVPEGCEYPLRHITLFPARPAGVNEPTAAGVQGSERILDLLAQLTASDLCLVLLSGGASALMPAPVKGITLQDKLAVTRHLSAAGANIQQLNTVRKQLSLLKGGGLARACRAGRLVSLIVSDVLGDPLDIVASGPTAPNTTSAADALEVLKQFDSPRSPVPDNVLQYLQGRSRDPIAHQAFDCAVSNHVIGNNATAVAAAGEAAERRGYQPAVHCRQTLEGEAEDVGRHLAHLARSMQNGSGPDCLVHGGEPTVTLVPESRRGKGGRNQQLVLAALHELLEPPPPPVLPGRHEALNGLVILSGGTDGEDGPTDAAGAVADGPLAAQARQRLLDPLDYLRRNDAYHFFQPLGGLLQTGPTHTNVCDVRIVLCER
jgi:hydroxypyruvate reductase